jgi:hypothetical protein
MTIATVQRARTTGAVFGLAAAVLLVPALFVVHGRTAWRRPVALALVVGLAGQGVVRVVGLESAANPVSRAPGAYVITLPRRVRASRA